MNYFFHPEAEKELIEAVDYYEGIELGLGYDFALEVFSAIQKSADFPDAWTPLKDKIRRSILKRFPYGIIYSKERKGLFILAIMNLHRRPNYWKDREKVKK